MQTKKILSVLFFVFVASQCALGFQKKLSRFHGSVASPNFTLSSYPDNYDEQVEIEVVEGHVVALYFDTFNVEEGGSAKGDFPCGDFVELLDGKTNERIAKMCGNSGEGRPLAPSLLDQVFRSSGNKMVVRMKSDGSNGGIPGQADPTGFRAFYRLEDIDECLLERDRIFDSVDNDTNCEHSCVNFPGGFTCACDNGFRLDESNGRSCLLETSLHCDGAPIKVTEPGIIISPMYKNNYARNVLCTWMLIAEPGENIYLNFLSEFDLELAQNHSCNFDYVKVEDHTGVVGTFCGREKPTKELKSFSDWMKITFVSDYFVEGAGFTVRYESRGVRCRIPKIPKYASITSKIPARSSDGYRYLMFEQTLSVRCPEGFYMQGGSPKLRCLKDGSFNKKLPKCIPL